MGAFCARTRIKELLTAESAEIAERSFDRKDREEKQRGREENLQNIASLD